MSGQTPGHELEPEIDVAAVMRDIQAAVLARRREAEAGGPDFERLASLAWMLTPGRTFPAEVYKNLFEAAQRGGRIHVPLQIAPSRLPLIGPLLDRVKAALHRVTLAYLDQLADRQAAVNAALVAALAAAVQALDERQARVVELERRVQQLENRPEP